MEENPKRGNKRQGVTIKEVAERAGVSQMTVSRVLNKKAVVKPSTREKVEAAIAELNYRPNMLARGLAGGKSFLIGFLYHNPSYGYLNEFLHGALEECRELGHHLVVEAIDMDALESEPSRYAEIVRRVGVDGLIVNPPLSDNHELIAALREIGLPFVRIAHGDLSCADLSVVINDADAAKMMTLHLIKRGHRRIAFIVGARNQTSSAMRFAGFKAAMSKHKLHIDRNYIASGDYTFQSGVEATHQLLSLAEPPTAIFASNDEMAAGVIAAAHQRGLRLPDELSIAGFDDTALAQTVWPPLTTIRQPVADMARRSVSLLTECLVHGEVELAERLHILDVALVERESVAPPPGGVRD